MRNIPILKRIISFSILVLMASVIDAGEHVPDTETVEGNIPEH